MYRPYVICMLPSPRSLHETTTFELATYKLKMTNDPNLVVNSMNLDKLAAGTYSFAGV